MEYKIIEKTEYGVRVRNYSGIPDCNLCKYHIEKRYCTISECAPNSYYLPDSEVEKLEYESDLKAKNEELETRIKELEATIENMNAANEWISVEDELPKQITNTAEDEENGNTLYFYEHYAVKGYFENKAKTESIWIGVYRPYSVGWYFQVIKPQKTLNFIITHWKPIN